MARFGIWIIFLRGGLLLRVRLVLGVMALPIRRVTRIIARGRAALEVGKLLHPGRKRATANWSVCHRD